MKGKKWVSGFLAGLLTLGLFSVFPATTVNAGDIKPMAEKEDGLVLYVNFEEDTIKDGKVLDKSPAGNNGQIVGDVKFVEGISGKAASFDNGAASGKDGVTANQYINLGKPASLQFGTGDFSLSLWMKTTNRGANGAAIISNKNYTSGSNIGVTLGNFNSTEKDNRMNFSALKGQRVEVKNIPANDDAWHHVGASFARNGDMIVYLDGVEYQRLSIAGQRGTVDAGLDWILGAGGNGCNGLKDCLVDEVRLYNQVVAPQRMLELYREVAGGEKPETELEKGLVLHTTFEENTVLGTQLKDTSGRNNHGVLEGGVTFVDGVNGRAAWFDNGEKAGSDTVAGTQFINFGKAADLQFGTGDFAFSFWMKTTGGGQSNSAILSNKDYASGSNVGYAFGNFSADNRANFSALKGKRADVNGVPAKDDVWHHVAVSFQRKSDMVVYLDGKEFGRSAIAGFPASVDAGLDFVLGAGGNKKNALSNCAVDELRVYNRSLTLSDISLLYAQNGAQVEILNMLQTAGKIQPSSVFTAMAIEEIKTALALAKKQADGASASEAEALLGEIRAQYNEFMKGETPKMSFLAVSDVHIPDATGTRAVDFIAGLQDMKKIAAQADGFVNGGDLTPNGLKNQMEAFYKVMAENNPVAAEKTLVALGNHDVRGESSGWTNDPTKETPYYKTAYDLYMNLNTPYQPDTGGKVYHDKWLGGYHFIVLNTEKGLKDSAYLTPEQLAWLEQKLGEEASPDKPIFIVVHQALKDTHWRSNILNSFGTEDAAVKQLLEKYPQTIVMNGHIHNGFGVLEAVERSFGTMVELPSYSESENGVKDSGTGFYTMVYENEVVFRARNFKTGTWLPEYDLHIALQSLPSLYQQAKALDEESYTAESWAPIAQKIAQAEELFARTYVQDGIVWNDLRPPAEALFGPETRTQANALAVDFAAALAGLVTLEGTKEIAASQNVYLQAGKDATAVSTAYSNYDKNLLKVKNSDDNKNQNYTRKTLLAFPLGGVSASHNQGVIRLQLRPEAMGNPNPGPHFKTADVYLIDGEWGADSVTWNSSPAEKEKIATITPADIDAKGVVSVNIGDAAAKASQQGKTNIAFEISIDTQANDNKLEFYSSRAEGKDVPTLALSTRQERPDDPAFAQLRLKWADYLLGGELDTGNTAVKAYINTLDTATGKYWADMVKSDVSGRTNLWNDLDMSYVAGTGAVAKEHSGNVSTTYYRLRDLAVAYATKGTKLYENQQVKQEIILALDHLYEGYYNESETKTPVFGNWWHWEIGTPIASLSTALILYDDLSPKQIRNYTSAVNRYSNVCDKPSGYPGSPAMTGANLIDKGTAVALSGILSQNAEKMQHVKDAFKTVFQYVTTGDGFYEDGSFIQHQALAFMGGYGKQLYEKLSIFFVVLKDSEWKLQYDDHAENLVFDMIFKGIEPFFYQGLFMDMVSGRDITRSGSNDKIRGNEILTAILPMSDAMPTPEMKSRFDSMVKQMIGADEAYFYQHCNNITAVMKANDIMQDTGIAPRGDLQINKSFGGMDKWVYSTSGYTLGLSMHSSRTYGHELINDEGKRTWNISDGMTYLYNGDLGQFSGGYWATVDPTRLPGTTVEHKVFANGAGDRKTNVYSWVGGSALDMYGAAGMQYKAHGTGANPRNGAEVKKSWFMLGEEIIAVGGGISSATGNHVETIVDNRKILADASNIITVNGKQVNLFTDNGSASIISSPQWVHLAGGASGSDMGYYFPQAGRLQGMVETRTGDWTSQGTTSGKETGSYATFWFDHGANPNNASYSYVLLPGKTAEQTAAYAAQNDISVIENSQQAHGIAKPSAGITMVNFWQASETPVGGISANGPASVTMEKKAGVLRLAVADPTQLSSAPIEITLAAPGAEVLAKDENITVLNSGAFVKIAVDTAGLAGKSSVIEFAYDETAELEVIEAIAPQAVKVPLNTQFKNLPLPKQVEILANDSNRYEVPVEWQAGSYNRASYGVYKLEGALTLPEGISNTLEVKASIFVQVGEVSSLVMSDTYVQGGSDGGRPSTEYAVAGQLIVKNDAGDQRYTRKTLLQFSIADMPRDFEHAYFEFELIGLPSENFTTANIYQVENNWKPETVTYNTIPARVKEEPVGALTMAQAQASLRQKVEITQAVKAALEAGETVISFEISIPEAAKNNYVGIYSSTTTNAGAQKPAISWEKTPPAPVEGETNLEMLIRVAENLQPQEFSNYSGEALAPLLQQAKALLQNPNATVEEVRLAEQALNEFMHKLRRKPLPKN